MPDGLHGASEAREAARAPRARRSRRGRHRLGAGRGARVRVAARRGDPDPAHGPGHRARHVLAPPPRPARRGERARRTRRSSICARRRRRSRSSTRRCPSTRRARLRVRLLRRGARRRSCSGRRSSATSSTARRSIDRPVHRLRPLEVGADVAPDAAPAARLRGQRPGALERAARAVPPARGAGEHPRRRTRRRPRSTSTCSGGRRSTRRPGR